MAVTNTPAWPQVPRYAVASIASANAATDGTGTITTLMAAGPNGTRLSGLYAGASATVSDTAVRFFLSSNGGATWTYLPHLERLVAAHTLASTTVNDGRVTVINQHEASQFLDLPADAVLGCAIAVSVSGGAMIAEAIGADY